MSTAGQTEASSHGEARPNVAGWFRRLVDRCLDATGLRAPAGYEDESGFHYGSLPLAEQERIARRNMASGEGQNPVSRSSDKK
jgi:hypothetical protein